MREMKRRGGNDLEGFWAKLRADGPRGGRARLELCGGGNLIYKSLLPSTPALQSFSPINTVLAPFSQDPRRSSPLLSSLTSHCLLVKMSSYDEEIVPGDLVAVRHGIRGRQEGLVVGSHIDYAGRQIIEVQLENEIYHAWHPTVTRVKRVVSYSHPQPRARTIERRIYW